MGPVGFDLDMTLINSRPAILASFAEVARETATAIDLDAVDRRLGIKLDDELAFWFPPEQGAAAAEIYRRHYVDLAERMTTALPGAQAQVQSGVMRGLAITTKERWPSLPDVPTLDEQGFPGVALNTEHFLFAPAATPPDVVERLTKATLVVLAQDAVKDRVRQLGYLPIAGGPDAVKERIAKNVPFFKELVANAKIPQIQ